MHITLPAETRDQLKGLIRSVPDFPKPGIVFRDITPLLADPEGLLLAIRTMSDPFRNHRVDAIVGVESRGFIFGAAIARELNCGFVPVRKPGKLPADTIAMEYDLEYGTDTIEIHRDAIEKGQRVLMVDDLLATGGTMKAACDLIEQLGGEIVGVSILIELAFINGRDRLAPHTPHAVITYDAE